MKLLRRKPDHQAESVTITADGISKPEYIHATNTHGSNVVEAKGDVVIEVKKGHPCKDKDMCPEAGDVLVGKGKDKTVVIEARRFGKIDRSSERQSGRASMRVRIFGRLQRRPKE